MMQIHLHELRFFAFHGLYEEERILGNHFEVNMDISYNPVSLPVNQLYDTINYVSVYELIADRMAIATPLLETLATEIAMSVLNRFSMAEQVVVSIYKLGAPIENFEGKLGVSFTLNRD
ncbi:MAG TPA: dihydroneopterin aldolase [Sediminibacterium sp.]|nr:dihydroneopterin aldolase [Sediminibacterium sp.]